MDSDSSNPSIRAIRYHQIENKVFSGKLIVTEKIDGANIGIGFVNGVLQFQSRNFVKEINTTEFGMDKIVDALVSMVESMKRIMKHDNFLVYGEIFGKKVMNRMNYNDSEASRKAFNSETVFFRAFDIYDIEKKTYWKYSDAIDIFEQVGLPYIPILEDVHYENIGDLYALVEKHKSAYSALPVEGFVLKKDEAELSCQRTIFKVKREAFDEKALNKFKVKNYVTENRFLSAYSKIGNDSDKIKEEMIEDCLRDIISIFRFDVKKEVENYMDKNYKNFLNKKIK